MTSGRCRQLVLWFTLLIALFEGSYGSNSTQTVQSESVVNKTVTEGSIAAGSTSGKTEKTNSEPADNSTTHIESTTTGTDSTGVEGSELLEIFQGEYNGTETTEEVVADVIGLTECANASSANVSCEERSWNPTAKTNYTVVAEAVGALDPEAESLQKTAAVAAGIFLVSAVVGYFSCVGYRRFLQRKYGNSQILVAEEVYDTTDLRYFEI